MDKKAALTQVIEQLNALQSVIDEAPASSGGPDLKAQVDAVVKERDALREAIKKHVEDEKTDTAELEKALEPIEEAPAPVVPEAPAPAAVDAAQPQVANAPALDGKPGAATDEHPAGAPVTP